jgi:hypothetical protein
MGQVFVKGSGFVWKWDDQFQPFNFLLRFRQSSDVA